MWSAGRTLAFMPLAHQHLDLQEAADRLGVHYQTAYRWVRTGRLPASLIDGRYTIDVADLDALESVRHTPRRPAAPSARRLQRSAERVRIDLLAGDEIAVRALARRLVDEGSSVVEVIQSLFVSAMYEIGQAWQAGQIAIWQEHRAAAIVERVIGDLAPNPRGQGAALQSSPPSPEIVTGCRPPWRRWRSATTTGSSSTSGQTFLRTRSSTFVPTTMYGWSRSP